MHLERKMAIAAIAAGTFATGIGLVVITSEFILDIAEKYYGYSSSTMRDFVITEYEKSMKKEIKNLQDLKYLDIG